MAPASPRPLADPARTSLVEASRGDSAVPLGWAEHPSSGFTLIELLVVVVILGILAGIANNFLDARKFEHIAALQADMRTLVAAQEEYFLENQAYAKNANHLDVALRENVQVTMVATSGGWSMRVRDKAMLQFHCSMFSGEPDHSFPPAVEAGVMECAPRLRGVYGSYPGGG